MTWHLVNIPKIAHFYWGNDRISFLRYLSVLTFRKFNPEWKIMIHYPKTINSLIPTWNTGEQGRPKEFKNYIDEIENIDNVEFLEHDFATYGFDNKAHEVHKSDFLRWCLLSEYGGIWSDFDIIYTNSINNIKENIESNKDINIALCKYRTGAHAIGFLMAEKSSKFFEIIRDIAKKNFNKKNYQSIGSMIFNNYFKYEKDITNVSIDFKPIFLDQDCVYKIDADAIPRFYSENIPCPNDYGVIGFHWYAGHPLAQKYEQILTLENYKEHKNTISNIIEKALNV